MKGVKLEGHVPYMPVGKKTGSRDGHALEGFLGRLNWPFLVFFSL